MKRAVKTSKTGVCVCVCKRLTRVRVPSATSCWNSFMMEAVGPWLCLFKVSRTSSAVIKSVGQAGEERAKGSGNVSSVDRARFFWGGLGKGF